jgi:hypothetical protein
VRDLSKYVGTHRMHVRRARGVSGDAVDMHTGYRIAISALKMFETKYGFAALVDVARNTFFGAPSSLSPRSRAAICSDYYNRAVARVLERGAVSAKIDPFTPADLSASTNMIDVEVPWLALPR